MLVPSTDLSVTPNFFIVRDADGQALRYIYYESESGRRSTAKLLTEDAARRIAANTAKLPELLKALMRLHSPTHAGAKGSELSRSSSYTMD